MTEKDWKGHYDDDAGKHGDDGKHDGDDYGDDDGGDQMWQQELKWKHHHCDDD